MPPTPIPQTPTQATVPIGQTPTQIQQAQTDAAATPAVGSSSTIRSTLTAAGADASAVPPDATSAADVKAAVAPAMPAPGAPNYVSQYAQMRAQNGVPALEDKVNTFEGQKAALQEQMIKFKAAEMGTSDTAAGYSGRVSDQQRNVQAQLDSLNLEEGVAQQALATKNSFISTMMDLTEKDYAASSALYDKTFTQNLQIQTMLNTQAYHEQTLAEKAGNDARAKLATMQQVINNQGLSMADAIAHDPKLEGTLNQLEMQAGFPPGFMETFSKGKPKADIVATTEGTINGMKVMSILSRGQDGQMTMSHYNTGTASTKPSLSDQKAQLDSDISSLLQPGMKDPKTGVPFIDSSGYMTPEGFTELMQQAQASAPSMAPADFIKNYGEYLYPGDKGDYSGYKMTAVQRKLLTGASSSGPALVLSPGTTITTK